MKKLLLILVAALPLIAQTPAAQVAWTHEAGEFAHHRALAVNAAGESLMAFTSFPWDKVRTLKQEKGLRNRLGIMAVDDGGTVLFDTDVPRPESLLQNKLGPSAGDITGATFLDDGEFVLAVEYVAGRTWLLRFDRAGKSIYMKPLAEPQNVFALVHATDGNIIVIGRRNTDLLVAKYDINGKRLWETPANLGNAAFPRGGVATPGGGVVVVSDATTQDLHHAGPSEVVVTPYNSAGTAGVQRRFNGHLGNIARDANGAIAVAYAPDATHVRVRTYDASLNETGDMSREVGKTFVPDFQIAAVSGRGFVLFGASDFKPMVGVVGARGIEATTPELSIPLPQVSTVIARGDTLYVASTELHEEGGLSGIRARLTKIALSPAAQVTH